MPRQQPTAALEEKSRLVERACALIDGHLTERLALEDLATALDVSPGHLQRVFKKALGISPRQYLEARRVERLKGRLRERETVTAALYDAGYGSSRGLYERAATQLGMTPAAYRKGGKGMHIRFTLTDCHLGRMLFAATERGVSAVQFADDDTLLEAELREEYPAAVIERDDGALRPWLNQLLEHLAGQRPDVRLPLDVRATAFQWRVWQELCRIPRGSTRTYADVAAAIGEPAAVRAVGRACATNPVSILIPCHRVVRGNGGLGGYRWGLGRKEQLLKQERGESE